MNSESILIQILAAITSFGGAMLVVVAAALVVITGFLVAKKGLNALINDQSLSIGGFYVRNTPYKGYNRWRSREWNMNHTA